MPDDALEIHEGTMACPVCHDVNGTHIDQVYALAREREDADPTFVTLNSDGGLMPVDWESYPHAFGSTGRRHEFVLSGWCEMGCGFWFVTFRQHKGQTLVRITGGGPVSWQE